jgi:hypothetical protein
MFFKKRIFGDMSRDVLVADLVRVAGKIRAGTVTRRVYKKKGRYSLRQYYVKFGSWNAGLLEAGLLTWNNVTRVKDTRYVSDKLRLEVFKRDNFKCVICGASPSQHSSVILHIDHIVPFCRGGETVVENLQTLCSRCNLEKGARVRG